MKRLIPVCLFAWCSALPASAGPTEVAIVAAMRLSEQPNYSWVTTVSDDARTYDIQGRTSHDGITRVRMPVINTVRRQLGRSVTDTDVDLIFNGNVSCVIETDHGWLRPDELRRSDLRDADSPFMPGTTGHAPLLGAPAVSGGMIRGSIIRAPRPPTGKEAARAYSNLQLALSRPHEELGIIVGSHAELSVDGDVVSGVLTDLGAQLLLVRDGQDAITPVRASGTFKLWLRDGIVARYQLKLEGILSVELPAGRREVTVHQSSETVLKNIGTTTFEVPTQARAKLRI